MFLFIPLAFTVFNLEHTGFYYYAVFMLDLISGLADPFWLSLLGFIGWAYLSKTNRFSLVGPFSMLTLVVGGFASVQFFLLAARSLANSISGGLRVTSFIPDSANAGILLEGNFLSIFNGSWFIGVTLIGLVMVIFLASRGVFLGMNSSIRRTFWQNRVLDQLVLLIMLLIFSTLLLVATNFLFLFLA